MCCEVDIGEEMCLEIEGIRLVVARRVLRIAAMCVGAWGIVSASVVFGKEGLRRRLLCLVRCLFIGCVESRKEEEYQRMVEKDTRPR